ncbi:MAG: sel1 repeat family protein [Bacteroidetes bacterium]|nr:sel1 repeat family protein [Bacteroidota bacterium]
MTNKLFSVFFSVFIIFAFSNQQFVYSQDSTSSLAYKKKHQFFRYSMFYRADLSYQLWHQFKLVQKAKGGDPIAEHELGLRYLMGEGFVSDTTLGAKWIGNAARKDLTSAEYNYAILLNNGWGVEWNPFQAYDYFQKAALDGMPQAEYILGVTHLNNLVVKKDLLTAYEWLKKSAESGFLPAKEYLIKLEKKISPEKLKKAKKSVTKKSSKKRKTFSNYLTSSTPTGLEIIDFDLIQDSATIITDKHILGALLTETNINLADTLGITEKNDSSLNILKSGLPFLNQSAEAGNPEALTLLGRMHQKGKYFKKDNIKAAAYYLRAARLNLPIAANLLFQLSKNKKLIFEIRKAAKKQEAIPMYIWYGLYVLGIQKDIAPKDAFKLLYQSANKKYIPAMVELGLSYYTGNLIKKDKDRAKKVWESAAKLESEEALTRIAATNILEKKYKNIKLDIDILMKSEKMGSILAEVTLASLYEKGIGVKKDKTKAVMYYRSAAQRGNSFAFNQLRKMYDEIRPPRFRF